MLTAKLTEMQIVVLRLAKTSNVWNGAPAGGGRAATVNSLKRLGLLNVVNRLTPQGEAMLEELA